MWKTSRKANVAVATTVPITIGHFGPTRRISTDTAPAASSVPAVIGSSVRPAPSASDPKPYPNRPGVWTNWITRMNAPYMPAPVRKVAMLVPSTTGVRIIAMSTSGSRTRRSTTTHATSSTTAPANRPRTVAEPQPHAGPRLMPSTRQTRPPASVSRPKTST